MKDANQHLNAPMNAMVMRDHWTSVQARLNDVLNCLERESTFASGQLKLRLTRVAEFLEQDPDCDDVLNNRDALALLLPVWDVVAGQGGVSVASRGEVEIAVRQGVLRIAATSVYRRNWLQLFWYPAVVLSVALVVSVVLSFMVAPQFKAMLEDMYMFVGAGKANGNPEWLPWITRLAFSIAGFLRLAWPGIAIGFGVLIFAVFWINRQQRRRRASGLGWWDDQNISVRGALAVWSDHLANLLKAGTPQTEAFAVASGGNPKEALRKLSSALAERDRAITDGDVKPYFPLQKYAMLDHALKQDSLTDKSTALEEVAFYYRNRDRFVSTWWMSWISTALLWMTGAIVLLLFLAMFLPLYGTIRALSGLVMTPVISN